MTSKPIITVDEDKGVTTSVDTKSVQQKQPDAIPAVVKTIEESPPKVKMDDMPKLEPIDKKDKIVVQDEDVDDLRTPGGDDEGLDDRVDETVEEENDGEEEDEEEGAEEGKSSTKEANPESKYDDVERYLKDHPELAAQLRGTIPISQDQEEDDDEEEGEKKGKSKQSKVKKMKTKPKVKPKKVKKTSAKKEDEREEEDEDEKPKKPVDDEASEKTKDGEKGEGEEVDEEDEEEENERENDEDYDSDICDDEINTKEKLMASIKDMRKIVVNGPIPEIGMPVKLLLSIKGYYKEEYNKEFWLGVLSMAYCTIIGRIEALNEQFDPFGKIFHYSLKLKGAQEAIEGNLSQLRNPLSYYAKRIAKIIPKNQAPLMQLVGTTIAILSKVHENNVRMEAMEAFRNSMASGTTSAATAAMTGPIFDLGNPAMSGGNGSPPPTFKPQTVYDSSTQRDKSESGSQMAPQNSPTSPSAPSTPITAHLQQTLSPPQVQEQPKPSDVLDLKQPTTQQERIELKPDDDEGNHSEDEGDDDNEEGDGSDADTTYDVISEKK